MKKYIVQIIEGICGILLAFTPFTLFPVCTKLMKNGGHMACYYSGKLIVAMGIVIAVCSVWMMLKPSKKTSLIGHLIIFVASFACYALPHRLIGVGNMQQDGWMIGLCKDPMMQCNHTTMPSVHIIVGIVCTISLLAFVMATLKEGKDHAS